jgi:hypothetical protein
MHKKMLILAALMTLLILVGIGFVAYGFMRAW